MVRAMCPGKVAAVIVLVLLLGPGLARADLHDPWEALLKRYVDEQGRVAYRSLQAESAGVLDDYLRGLGTLAPSALPTAEQIAFWINGYNARVVRGILDGYNAEGLFARKRFFAFYRFELAGGRRTLDEIEHEILRKRYREPRIHFALVCASTSCPRLRREAYRGDRLDAQLDAQAREFLADPRRNQIGSGEAIRISRVFDWFGDDFVQAAGSVPNFIRRYQPLPHDPRVEYLDYDWTMNAQPGQRPE